MTHSQQRTVAIVTAIPMFLVFPVGVMVLFMSARYPTGDPPFIAMIPGFTLGVAFGVALGTLAWFCAKHGVFRASVIIIIGVSLFDLAVVPLARWVTRVERDRKYQESMPNKERRDSFALGDPLIMTRLSHDGMGPTLSCSGFDPQSRTAIVELTNATRQSWLLQLRVAHGLPRPSYFITPEKKGLPGWGAEFEEGIYCSGYLYRRDLLGRYVAPEVPGPSPHLTGTFTNVVLHPKEVLTFSVPIGEIHGLSKVGVTYHRPPASSRLERAAAGVRERLRRILHFQPATPDQGWCETALRDHQMNTDRRRVASDNKTAAPNAGGR